MNSSLTAGPGGGGGGGGAGGTDVGPWSPQPPTAAMNNARTRSLTGLGLCWYTA